jgi:hypothetical protein
MEAQFSDAEFLAAFKQSVAHVCLCYDFRLTKVQSLCFSRCVSVDVFQSMCFSRCVSHLSHAVVAFVKAGCC